MKHLYIFLFFFLPFQIFAQCEQFTNFPGGEQERYKTELIFRDIIFNIKIAEKVDSMTMELTILYNKAFEKWKLLTTYCTGNEYHIFHGIRIYSYFAKTATDTKNQKEYHDKVLTLYDQYIECFGDKLLRNGLPKKGDLLRKKAIYMQYKAKSPTRLAFDTYTQSIAITKNKTRASIFSSYTYLLKKLYREEIFTTQETRTIVDSLLAIVDYNLEKGIDTVNFQKAKRYIHNAFPLYEPTYFDCDYFIERDSLKQKFEENYRNIDYIKTDILPILQKVGCPQNHDFLKRVVKRIKDDPVICFFMPSAVINEGHIFYKNEEYEKAIGKYLEAVKHESTIQEQKADLSLKTAKIAFAKLKDYPRARKLAEQALEYRPNWGEPHLLIGLLYASSGVLCGSETDFDSQRLVWVAIDEWNKAKEVDNSPEIQKKANEYINKYKKYMPTKEETFEATKLNVGDSYFVPCWIQKSTVIRGI